MKKRNKRILYIIMATIVLAIAIVPSFAADGQSYQIYVHDEHVNVSLINPIEVNTLDDNQYLITRYDTSTYNMIIYQSPNISNGPSATGSIIVYQIQLPQYYKAVITYNRGNTEILYTMGYTGESSYTINTIGDTSTEYTYIEIELINGNPYNFDNGIIEGRNQVINNPNDYNLYTSTQYNNYGDTRYNSGVGAVQNNPNNYNLYSAYQYNQYGQEQYLRGKAEATVNNGYTEQEYQTYGQQKYSEGLQRGQEDAKTLVGIANVGMTGIARVFNSIVTETGIFGTAVVGILATGVIIMIVYIIYKAVRS